MLCSRRRALNVGSAVSSTLQLPRLQLRGLALLGLAPLGASLLVSGCRGNRSADPPIHLQQNMDFQRFEAQEANDFFADGRAMRPQVSNTVARGELRADEHFYSGRVAGHHADTLPVPLTRALLLRGQERYDIYCAVCHGRTGDGQSVISRRQAMRVPPPAYTDPRLLAQPVGYFFDVITNGVRNMPAYGERIPAHDRWAIAAHVRALQIAGSGRCEQVPQAVRAANGWSCK